MQPLDAETLPGLLAGLPEWRLDAARGALHRRYVLQDFVQAFGFMAQVALAAERHDHHPEWSNVYKTVDITWTTHDAGGLTMKDIEMARLCDQAFAGHAARR